MARRTRPADPPNPFSRLGPARRKHAQKVGEIAIAWNQLHACFQWFFGYLTIEDGNMAPGMMRFAAIRSDQDQRALLRREAGRRLAGRPEILTELLWICNWTDALAILRNAFVHLPIGYKALPDGLRVELDPAFLGGPRFHQVRRRSAETYRPLRRDLMLLAGYTGWIQREAAFPGRFAPPVRPRLGIGAVFPDIGPDRA